MDVLQSILSGAEFMPHGMCYLWRPEVLWLHVVSDTVVALSYFAIPPTLVYLVLRLLTRQLEGTIELGEAGGTLWVLCLPARSRKALLGVS